MLDFPLVFPHSKVQYVSGGHVSRDSLFIKIKGMRPAKGGIIFIGRLFNSVCFVEKELIDIQCGNVIELGRCQ